MRYALLYIILCSNAILLAQEGSKLRLSGSASAQVRFYTAPKTLQSRPPWVFNLQAQPVLYYKKWRIPGRISIGNYQARFRDFNRYGFAPESEKYRIFIGHNSPDFGMYMLQGRPVLGVGFEKKTKGFRMGFYTGQVNGSNVRDTFRNRIFLPAFSRYILSLYTGIGDENNYILLGFLRGQDRKQSLDSISSVGLSSAANSVLSLMGSKTKGNLILSFQTAFSAYTGNPEMSERAFPVFTPARIPGLFIPRNASTSMQSAYHAQVKYKLNPKKENKKSANSISGLWDRVDPGYQSMGLYFIVSDIQRLRLSFHHAKLNGKFSLAANAGYEHNDLQNQQFFANKRLIGAVTVSLKPANNWTHQITLQNYSVRLLVEGVTLEDSLVINQVNRNFMWQSSGRKSPDDLKSRMMIFSAGYQGGRNIVSGTSTRTLGHIFVTGRYVKPATEIWTVSPSLAIHSYRSALFNTTRYLPAVSLDRKIHEDKMNVSIESGPMITFFNGKYINTALRCNLSGIWSLRKKDQLRAGIFVQRNFQKGLSFTELQGDLRWVHKF